MCKIVGVFLLLIASAAAFPASIDDLLFDEGHEDTAVVESVRETRAVVPDHIEELLQPGVNEAFLHSYGDKESDDDDNVQGYHKTTQDKGSDGYKHFDSYHKKDGDKYGFEKHTAYGKKNKAEAAAGKGKKGEYTTFENDDFEDDDGSETKQAYKVVEEGNENKKGQKSAIEDYEGDSGSYADSGNTAGYTEGEAESGEAEAEADGGEFEEYSEGEGDSGAFTDAESEGESYPEYDAESEADDDY